MFFFVFAVTAFAAARAAGVDVAAYREIIGFERARAFDPRLVALLDAPDPAVAARAALALGRTKQPAAIVPLARAAQRSTDPAARALAVYALGLLAGERTPAALIGTALDDRSSAVRLAACDAAGRFAATRYGKRGQHAARFVPVLLGRLRSDPDAAVRSRAAIALAEFANAEAAGTIASALERAFGTERNPAARWHIAWTIGRGYAYITPRTFLRSLLRDRDDVVRVQGVRALARLHDSTLARFIEPLRADPSWRVQEEASEALREFRGQGRTDHLAALPPGLHLDPVPAAEASPEPRPSPTGSPGTPAVRDARIDLPLHPSSAALMNGPMPGLHPRVRLTTTQGALVVRLYPEWAPQTAANFLNLTHRGYFDGLRFFRIVPDFVVQTGDSANTGEGDAGYTIPAEENPVEQRAGVISMALEYGPDGAVRDSGATQFYITISPQLYLGRSFTAFGEVESGFAVLGHLAESDRIVRAEAIADD